MPNLGLTERNKRVKRPETLNQVSLDVAILPLLGVAEPCVVVTMSVGQWDVFLQVAYDTGHVLLELDDNECPVHAYRKGQDVTI